jgi:hypothetical protein
VALGDFNVDFQVDAMFAKGHGTMFARSRWGPPASGWGLASPRRCRFSVLSSGAKLTALLS